MISRHASGSCCSARSIEPITSAKRTVTCLRSPSREVRPARIFSARCSGTGERGSGSATEPPCSEAPPSASAAIALPQALQNRWPAGFSAPQSEHRHAINSGAAQFPQNRAWDGLGRPQPGQSMRARDLWTGVPTLLSAARRCLSFRRGPLSKRSLGARARRSQRFLAFAFGLALLSDAPARLATDWAALFAVLPAALAVPLTLLPVLPAARLTSLAPDLAAFAFRVAAPFFAAALRCALV